MKRDGVDLSREALNCLLLYDWPGNVRQLANEIRRFLAMAEPDDTITPQELTPEVRATLDTARPDRHDRDTAERPQSDPDELTIRIDQPLSSAIEQLERAMIHRAIRDAGGRVNTAAMHLGLSRKGLFLKRRRLGINPEAVA